MAGSTGGHLMTWGPSYLFSLNLHIRPGQLVAVVGQVGAGKSSLISALLGEVEKVEGTVTLRVSVAKVWQASQLSGC